MTNVFTLGRMALVLLGDGSGSLATWSGTEQMLAIALRAASPNRAQRHQSVREFVMDWQAAAAGRRQGSAL